MPAKTLKSVDLEDSPDKGGLEAKLKEQYFARPLQLTLRARMDTYNGETRANVTCVDARAVPYAEHGRKMLAEIQAMFAAGA